MYQVRCSDSCVVHGNHYPFVSKINRCPTYYYTSLSQTLSYWYVENLHWYVWGREYNQGTPSANPDKVRGGMLDQEQKIYAGLLAGKRIFFISVCILKHYCIIIMLRFYIGTVSNIKFTEKLRKNIPHTMEKSLFMFFPNETIRWIGLKHRSIEENVETDRITLPYFRCMNRCNGKQQK